MSYDKDSIKSNFEKKNGLPDSVRKLKSTKLPAKIKTVSDLLSQSDINEVVSNLVENKDKITDIITVYYTKDGTMYFDASAKCPKRVHIGRRYPVFEA